MTSLCLQGFGKLSVLLIEDEGISIESSNITTGNEVKWISIENGVLSWYVDEFCEIPQGFGVLNGNKLDWEGIHVLNLIFNVVYRI